LDAGHRCWPGPECVGTRTCWWRIGRAVPVRRVSRLRSGNAQGAQAGIAPFLRGNAVFCGPVVEHHRGRKTVFYRGPNSPRWTVDNSGAPRRETIWRETHWVLLARPAHSPGITERASCPSASGCRSSSSSECRWRAVLCAGSRPPFPLRAVSVAKGRISNATLLSLIGCSPLLGHVFD